MVEDVAWHGFHPDIFGSVSDDKQLILWDMRRPEGVALFQQTEAHAAEVNCIAFNPLNSNILATGRCAGCGRMLSGMEMQVWRYKAQQPPTPCSGSQDCPGILSACTFPFQTFPFHTYGYPYLPILSPHIWVPVLTHALSTYTQCTHIRACSLPRTHTECALRIHHHHTAQLHRASCIAAFQRHRPSASHTFVSK